MTIAEYLKEDHRRLDALLEKALRPDGSIDREVYDEFRRGLLRHIGIEESILFPAAQRSLGAIVLERAAKLRLDHGALAAIMVLDPDAKIIHALRAIITPHNAIEEGPPGVYSECEKILSGEMPSIMNEILLAAPPPLAVRKQGEALREAARRTIERAGFRGSIID
jgi:hypothetical protein